MVSSELETAYAVSQTIGVPAAKQTDVFADGQVQIVEFDVPREGSADDLSGIPLTEAAERAAGRVRGGGYDEVVGLPLKARDGPRGLEGGEHHPRRPDARARAATSRSCPATGSSSSARPTRRGSGAGSWRAASQRVDDVVVFGAGAHRPRHRPRPSRAGHPRAPDRGGRGARARGCGGAAGRTGLQRDRRRPRLPRARADRPGERRGLRHARGLEEPLRGDAREGARHRLHHRDRPRARSRSRSSSGRGSTSPSTRARSRRRRSSASPTTRASASSPCWRATASRSSTSRCGTRASSCERRSRSCP